MKRLILTYEGQKIISDPFNFKAYRIIYEHLKALEGHASFSAVTLAGFAGIVALFDGTPITEEVIDRFLHTQKGLDAKKVMDASDKVIEWYTSVKPPKSLQAQTIGKPENPILHLYHVMLTQHGILPGELDKQDPQMVYDVLGAKSDGVININDIPAAARLYCGL